MQSNPKATIAGLSQHNITAITNVLLRHPSVNKVWLFGSRAMGTYKQRSDIDLAIDGHLSFEQMHALALDLDELMLPYEFDILALTDINNPQLTHHILRVGQVIFEQPSNQ